MSVVYGRPNCLIEPGWWNNWIVVDDVEFYRSTHRREVTVLQRIKAPVMSVKFLHGPSFVWRHVAEPKNDVVIAIELVVETQVTVSANLAPIRVPFDRNWDRVNCIAVAYRLVPLILTVSGDSYLSVIQLNSAMSVMTESFVLINLVSESNRFIVPRQKRQIILEKRFLCPPFSGSEQPEGRK